MGWITALAVVAAVPAALWWWPGLIVVGVVWLGLILFFRDPARAVPQDDSLMLAPADGKVTEITHLDHDERVGGPAVKLGIFLSVFDVHINRSPCAGVVRSIEYKRGAFHNALGAASSDENESNTLVLDAGPALGTLVVKQIAGLIARRIVCAAAVGDRLRGGQRFGMIKFGSRTELVLPQPQGWDIAVKIGDKVRAGLTVMARRRNEE